MARKQIPNSPASNTKERASGQSVEEATHDHGFDILRHRTGDEPYQEERKRRDIDVSPAIELDILAHLLGYRYPNKPPTTAPERAAQLLQQVSTNTTVTRTRIPSPKMKNDSPSVATSCEHSNCSVIWPYVNV